MFHASGRLGITLALLVLPIFPLFAQGLYWESSMKSSIVGDQEEITKTFYMPRMLKNVSQEEVSIVRLDKEIIYTLNPTRREYSAKTFAEFEAEQKEAGEKMKAQMGEMKKYLENLPPDQRKQVESSMRNQDPGGVKAELKATGERKKIAGHDCTKAIVMADGKELMTVWTTTDIPGTASLQKDISALSSRMGSFAPGQGKGMAEAMGKLNGFMIQMEMGDEMTMTVTKVEKRSTPVNEFDIPPGYKKVKSVESRRSRPEYEETEEGPEESTPEKAESEE